MENMQNMENEYSSFPEFFHSHKNPHPEKEPKLNFGEIESGLLLNSHHDRLAHLEIVGNHFIASYFDGTILFWNIHSDFRRSARELKGHSGAVFHTSTLDDNHFLSCSQDATARVWDIERRINHVISFSFSSSISSYFIFKTIAVHSGYVNHISRHLNFALTASASGIIKLWELDNKKKDIPFLTLSGHNSDTTCCASLTNETVVSGASDGEVQISKYSFFISKYPKKNEGESVGH